MNIISYCTGLIVGLLVISMAYDLEGKVYFFFMPWYVSLLLIMLTFIISYIFRDYVLSAYLACPSCLGYNKISILKKGEIREIKCCACSNVFRIERSDGFDVIVLITNKNKLGGKIYD